MFEQSYKRLQNMTVLSNVYSTISHMRNLKGEQIHSLTDAQRRLIRWVMDQGISVTNG